MGAEQSAGARGARGARCWSHYLDTVSMTLMADTLTVMKLPEISGLLRLWTVKLLAVFVPTVGSQFSSGRGNQFP